MAQANAKTPVATEAHEVVTRLRHDGKDYKPKSTVRLDAKSAKRLLAAGVVKKPAAAPAADAAK